MAFPSAPVQYEGRLLAPGDRASAVRPLVAWSARHRELVRERVLGTLAAWRADWCLDAPPADTQPLEADLARTHLLRQFTGYTLRDGATLAPAVATAAWTDWIMRMQSLTSGHFDAGLPPARTGWEGLMAVALPWWQGSWALRLSPEAVGHVVPNDVQPAQPAHPPLTPLQPAVSALADQLMELRAHFSPLTLTLGELESLRVGDVIPLAQGLNEPVQLLLQPGHDATGVPLCTAWLGQRQGRLAAELAAQPA